MLTTHLTEVLKDNMADLLSYAETQKLLDEIGREQKKLVEDLIPAQITIGGLQRVLQTLLGERVSIRDLPTILEGIARPRLHPQHHGHHRACARPAGPPALRTPTPTRPASSR